MNLQQGDLVLAVISDVEITICPIADDEECFGKYK